MKVATGRMISIVVSRPPVDPEVGFVECGYCDRRFVLIGGQADDQAA